VPDELGRIQRGERLSPETEIRAGQRLSPATEIKQGQRLSPRTEFKKGQRPRNTLEVGAVTIRKEKATGKFRAWVKIAEPNVWRHRYLVVWESVHGPIPKGMVVHHKDHDCLNDVIENLELKTRREHIAEHRQGLLEARRVAHQRKVQAQP
jgi:hypothetical protein